MLHSLGRAGAEVLAADLARQLRDRYRFVFFCLDDIGPLGEQLREEGFEVVHLGRRPGVDLSLARRLRRAVKRQGVSLLHAHQYTPFFYAALSRGLSASPPVLFTEHGRHYPDERRPKRVLANRVLLRRGDRVTAVGRFVRDALIENEGVAGDRVEVIYNGIEPAKFEAGDRVTARARMGLATVSGEAHVLLQVARLHEVKDHLTAVRAFARVAAEDAKAYLVLVGDGAQRPAVEAMIADMGLGEWVRLLGARQDVDQLMAGADVFVLSSLSEGISVTLLEAMAAGLPIAATAVGGNPEVVEHGRTGLLSPRRDDAALARNMLTLLRDAHLRRELGQAGHRRLMRLFTQARMHEAYRRMYDEML